jgi:hypothetical protein
VAETFADLLTLLNALPEYLPELNEYLLDYPNVQPAKVQADFYWEKVNFGLKPHLGLFSESVPWRELNRPCICCR